MPFSKKLKERWINFFQPLEPYQNEYVICFDFMDVDLPFTVSFEDNVQGFYTIGKAKPRNAYPSIQYEYNRPNKILDRHANYPQKVNCSILIFLFLIL